MKKIIKYLFLALFAGFTMVSLISWMWYRRRKQAIRMPSPVLKQQKDSCIHVMDIYRRLIWYRPVWTSVEMK